MNSVNFIPAGVLARQRVRRARRAWVLGLGLATLVLGPVAAGLNRLGRGALESVRQHRVRAEEAAELGGARERQMAGVRHDLERRLAVLDAIAGHPDWSRVLLLLAQVRGEEAAFDQITLERRTVTPAAAPGTAAAAAPAGRGTGGDGEAAGRAASARPPAPVTVMALNLEGPSRTPAAAAGLVVRLEATGLFESVRLVQTRPDGRHGPASMGFRVEAVFRGADREQAAGGSGVRTAAAGEGTP